MREFKSLEPEALPPSYDIEVHGEEPIITLTESEKQITIQYLFPGFYLSGDARDIKGEVIPFKQINIAHTGFLAESGKPLLPSFGRYVQIPFNCSYEVRVEKSKPIYFDDILVLPAQEKLTDTPRETAFEYDRTFYSRDQLYPEDIVEVSGPYEIDGYHALLLHVRPLQYNPHTKRITGYSTITITIHLSFRGPAHPGPDVDREAYGNLFLNPARDIEERVTPGRASAPTPSPRIKGAAFLIIYHDTFRKAAETLAQWKTMRGLSTEAVSLKTVGDSVKEMKEYIRKRKDSLRYVLLFGDVDFVPSEQVLGGPQGHNITDYYCGTIKDPKSKKEFVLPWFSVGRIPVRTAEEGDAVVERIISYEREPPEDRGYYTRMVFAGYFEDRGPPDGRDDKAYVETLETIRNHLVTLGYAVERIYVTTNPDVREYLDGVEVPEEVRSAVVDKATATQRLIAAVSEGCLIVGHRDHGGATGWVNPPFRTDHLDAVTGNTPTIFYSINCLTGRFDLRGPSDSFAEKLLKIKGGAPSVIAATRPSHTWLNDDLMKGLFDAVWAGVLPTFPGSTASYPVKCNRLGDVLNYAKTYLPITMSGSPLYIKDHFEIYHVLGDPTLELWKAQPAKMTVKAAVNRDYLDITLSTCPKEGVVTIWHDNEMIKRIEPSSTYVRVSLRNIGLLPPAGLPLSVCFWAPGFRFQEVVVR